MRSRVSRPLPLLSSLLVTALLAGPGAAADKPGLFDAGNLDPSVAACTDFFHHAAGGWIKANPRPADQAVWGRFTEVAERNQTALRSLLEAAAGGNAPAGSNERKIGDYYASCMDEAAIERQGIAPLKEELARIDAIASRPALEAEIARLQTMGVRAAFGVGSSPNFRNSEEMILSLREGGLGLPDRDDYLKDDEAAKKLREEYGRHVGRMLELTGLSAEAAAPLVPRIVALETRLATASKTRAERRDVHGNDNWLTLAELAALTPGFSWKSYLEAIGAPPVTGANVGSPKFLKALDTELGNTPLADWRAYLRWQLADSAAPSLTAAFVEEDFRFGGKLLRGTQENQPRWKRCVRATDRGLGEALGQVFVDKHFPPESKRRVLEMIENLSAVYQENLASLGWMSPETRAAAQKKLSTVVPKIGYPDKWIDYAPLAVARGSYAGNILAAQRFNFRRQLDRIGKPIDRKLWRMTPPTVNASYNSSGNEISFPAGILQPPFFDPAADDAWNYGAIGSVIGHELTHGFDDQGSQFDDRGNLRNWWSPTDEESFKKRAGCVEKQFGGYTVDGLATNGKLVLGEAIADLGGVKLAYAAYRRSLAGKPRQEVGGYSPEQRFFLGFASIWASSVAPESERLRLKTDPHPLGRFRVNGTVANLPEFAEAFGCKAGDPMVRPAAERCEIW